MDQEYAQVFVAFDTSIYNEDDHEVLNFLSVELGERAKLVTIKNLRKNLLEFRRHGYEPDEKGYTPTKKQVKRLNESLDRCLAKFAKINFVDITTAAIESDEPEFVSKFVGDLSFFKKSQERGTRWLIYHYYMNRKNRKGKFSIKLSKLESDLEGFGKVKNYQKLVEKLVLSLVNDGIDIAFQKKTKSILINSSPTNFEYVDLSPILSGLEMYSRAQVGQLEDRILSLIEYQPFANKEIVSLTGADKGHVSKVMNKLLENETIVQIGKSGNFQYSLTNCDKCPFDKKKIGCFEETSERISKFFNDKFGLLLNNNDFVGIDNHILRNMDLKLQSEGLRGYIAFTSHNSPSEQSYIKFYTLIFNRLLDSMKGKSPMEKGERILAHMPRLYVMGYYAALRESSKFEFGKVMELMEKVGISRVEIEEFSEEYVKHVDNVRYKDA